MEIFTPRKWHRRHYEITQKNGGKRMTNIKPLEEKMKEATLLAKKIKEA